MEKVVLKAERRSVIGKQVRALRRDGILPAILYGSSQDPTPIQMNLHDTMMALRGVSASTLITVDVEGDEHLALVREKQRDYIRNEFTHIDFQVVSMKEKLRVEVPVELVGESSAVADFGGILVIGLNTLDIECLPGDLPAAIEVDISPLTQIGDSIMVESLNLSDKLTVHNVPEDVVVVVTSQRSEEVAEEEDEEGELLELEEGETEPEVIERGKREEGEDF